MYIYVCINVCTCICVCGNVCSYIYREGSVYVYIYLCIYRWRVQDQSIASHNVNDRNLDEDSSGCSSNYSYNIFF